MQISRMACALVAALAIIATAVPAAAEGPTARKIEISGDDFEGQPVTLEELGALIVSKKGDLQVLFTMPGEQRLKAYRDVDVQEGDHLVMINGRKAATLDELKTALADVKVGDEINLGLKRGKDMKIISYPKADPDALPKVRRMTVTQGGPEGGPEGGPKVTMQTGGTEENVTIMTGGGLIARQGGDGPEIAYLLPDAGEVLGGADVKEKDRIVSLQGAAVADLAALGAAWDKVKVGDPVELVLARDGKEFTVKFARAEAPKSGMMMITK